MQNPYYEPQRLLLEQELKHREEMGIYQTPSWVLRVGTGLFIALVIISVGIVLLYWIWG